MTLVSGASILIGSGANMRQPRPVLRFLLWPLVLSPLGWAASLGWGLAMGRFKAPLPLVLSLGPILGALAVWQDRIIILQPYANLGGTAPRQLARVIRTLATVFAIVTVTACILLGVAYGIVRRWP